MTAEETKNGATSGPVNSGESLGGSGGEAPADTGGGGASGPSDSAPADSGSGVPNNVPAAAPSDTPTQTPTAEIVSQPFDTFEAAAEAVKKAPAPEPSSKDAAETAKTPDADKGTSGGNSANDK